MLYAIAHFLRDKMPWLWDFVDMANSMLFSLRYGRKLKKFKSEIPLNDYKMLPIREVPTDEIAKFFARQPENAYKFFKPHGFDTKSIKKLQKNKAFLAYFIMDKSTIAGYCFNRSFFHGKAFRGRMVDIGYRGKGLGTLMNRLLNEVGFGIGLRLYETVNKDNVASYRSALSASNIKVIDEKEDGDLFIEILKD